MPSNIPARKSRNTAVQQRPTAPHVAAETSEDRYDSFLTQMPRSAIRYVNTEGHEVIEQGKRRLVIHRQSPVQKRSGVFWLGIGMLVMLALFFALNVVSGSWQAYQVNAQYGYPRTWQVDAVVGHDDSPSHPSHFIFINLHSHVTIVEFPGGDVTHTRVYYGPILSGSGSDTIPITGSFTDMNGDGKPDLVVHIQEETIVYLNDGNQFKEQQ